MLYPLSYEGGKRNATGESSMKSAPIRVAVTMGGDG
jgi:hypothetical protein